MRNLISLPRLDVAFPALALLFLFFVPELPAAMPRTPLPPWPESVLGKWSFDEPLWLSAAQTNAGQPIAVDSTIWVPSWSGYSLTRQGVSVQSALSLPMVTTDHWNVAPDEGAVRFWYSPAFSSANTGQGAGPGHYARLLELAAEGGKGSVVFWSLYISPDGNTIYLSGEGDEGPVDFLKADIHWQAGEWHLVSISYGTLAALNAPLPWPTTRAVAVDDSPRATFLHLDGQLAATGQGFPVVPPMLAGVTRLAVGSSADGSSSATGQFEELTTFAYPLSAWQWGNYYDTFSPVAALGPVTQEELVARRAAAQAFTASLAANPPLLSAPGAMDALGGVGLMSFNYTNGFWLACPSIQQGTNVLLTLVNGDTNKAYDIYFLPVLQNSNNLWTLVGQGQGAQGQTNWTILLVGDTRFFRAYESGDWDRDGIGNNYDAQPLNGAVSNLIVTIEAPANGSTVP